MFIRSNHRRTHSSGVAVGGTECKIGRAQELSCHERILDAWRNSFQERRKCEIFGVPAVLAANHRSTDAGSVVTCTV